MSTPKLNAWNMWLSTSIRSAITLAIALKTHSSIVPVRTRESSLCNTSGVVKGKMHCNREWGCRKESGIYLKPESKAPIIKEGREQRNMLLGLLLQGGYIRT